MELRDYLRVLRGSWVLITLLTLLGIGAAAAYSLVVTPKYSSSATVLVATSGSGSVSELQQGNTFTQQRVNTYADLATRQIVLEPVAAAVGEGATTADLAAQVTATAPLNTSLIEVTAVDDDPDQAAAIAQAVSESLMTVVASVEVGQNEAGEPTSPVKLTLVQDATVPESPVSPNVPLNVALGALVGLALGVGIAVLRETLDTRIRNERDVEQITDLPVIGGIVFDPKAEERPLIVHADPRSPRAESFRTLRTNLYFIDAGRASRSFVVTSSVQSEGKSTTTANLAIALADAGARVLLVDADLRRPKVDQYLGIEGAVGLSDVLINRADLKDVIQRWGRNNMYALPAGSIPPNPSELLGSAAMLEVVSELDRSFDVVLYDAPPLLPVTDGAILARNVGGAIVVVAAGRTHKGQLRGAMAALANVNAPVSGVVMTMLPTKGPDAYQFGRYGYGHYGYGADEPAASR